MGPFFCRAKNIERIILRKSNNISKNLTEIAQGIVFGWLWITFWRTFQSNFLIQRNPLNCNQGISCSHQLPIIIASFFWHRSWSPLFGNLCWFCSKTINVGTPSKSSGCQKRNKIDQVAPTCRNINTRRTCFSESRNWHVAQINFVMQCGRPLTHFWYPFDSNGRQNATPNRHVALTKQHKSSQLHRLYFPLDTSIS